MRARSGLVLRQVGDMALVVPVGDRVVDLSGLVTLNETGAFLWNLLDGTHSPEDMAQKLASEFEVEVAQAEVDVRAFLDEMVRVGVVENAAE